jgi:hypothetical protein
MDRKTQKFIELFMYRQLFYLISLCVFSNWCFFPSASLAIAEEKNLSAALEYLEKIQDRVPNDIDYYNICSDSSFTLTSTDRARIFLKIVSMQSPQIYRKDLLQLFNAKKKSIRNGQISFTVYMDIPYNSPNRKPRKSECDYDFIFLDNKIYLKRVGKRWDTDSNSQIISYDGIVLRTVKNLDTELPKADICELSDYAPFFVARIPLFQAGVFEASRFSKKLDYRQDFTILLENKDIVRVYQQEEIVNDRKCIVAASPFQRLYFDPERDYSVVKYEEFTFEPQLQTDSESLSQKRSLVYCCDLLDSRDYGNGIWLPSKIQSTEYADGKVSICFRTSIKNISINTENLNSVELFSNIIPEKSFVVDIPRKMSYMQYESTSIDSLLKETAKSKRVFIYRYISVTAGLLMIIIALLLKYRDYLKDKRERENKMEEETK